MTTNENFINEFIDFEFRNKYINFKVEGVSIWNISRFMVFNEIMKKKFGVGDAHTDSKNISKMRRIFLKIVQIPDMLRKNPLYNTKSYDILILNHNRKVKIDEFYSCIYTDSLVEMIDLSSIVIEEPFLETHFKPCKTDNLYYSDYINFKASIKHKLHKRSLYKVETKIIIEKIIKQINTSFNTEFNYENLGINIHKLLINYKLIFPYYQKLINEINPKVIIEVVSYGLSRHVINDIANNMSIPTIELQHGTMGYYHEAYNFKEKTNISTFPKYIFVFGQYWKTDTRLPIPDENIKVVGWPYFEEKIKLIENERNNNDIKTILFISQGTIGIELSRIAVKLLNYIDLNKYRIIYKLHPGEYYRWKQIYPWLINTGLSVVDSNEHDMHYYFTQANIQIGVNSTALFEGIGYGLQTYIVKLNGYEAMLTIFHKGGAYFVDNAEEIIDNLEKSEGSKQHYDMSYFWSNNSLKNMINEINEVIEREKKNEF